MASSSGEGWSARAAVGYDDRSNVPFDGAQQMAMDPVRSIRPYIR
jgi:hypothetical protein